MNRAIFIIVLCGMIFPAVGRGASVAEVSGAAVTFPGGAGPTSGYLAKPEGVGPFPGVVMIHEWWGLSDWIKENARRLAGQGYVVLAVDLYHGKATDDAGEAHELMRALDDGEALGDLKGAVAYLSRQEAVRKGEPFAAIGWCMGGKFARLIAQESAAVGPTVICYGSLATEPSQVAKLKGKPTLGIFGADDRGIPVEKVRQFEQALKAEGNDAVMHVYEGAGHGFMRPGGPQHAASQTRDAWREIEQFLKKTLKPTL